ncbi:MULTISPECIES: hypothetical protein [unclassified Amycolatopsis]|uniref:hypothetical protein n=1 Tax=unclassified Amycolatopsis TaxID=2618356 RepID=UPI00106ED394|nr:MULTISPECIES: hypothetical protein [unclassified Amycolatopsis]
MADRRGVDIGDLLVSVEEKFPDRDPNRDADAEGGEKTRYLSANAAQDSCPLGDREACDVGTADPGHERPEQKPQHSDRPGRRGPGNG